MAFIETTREDDAEGVVAELFDADQARLGYVANLTQLFALRPNVFAAWRNLAGSITENLSSRRYELAAARRLRSSYCMLAHGKVLLDALYEPAELRDIVVDHRAAGLDESDMAVMASRSESQQTRPPSPRGRRSLTARRPLGCRDSRRCPYRRSTLLLLLEDAGHAGRPAGAAFAEIDPGLREALTVGRPIASG